MDRGGRTRRLWERLGELGGGEGVGSSMSSSEDTSPPMRRRSPMEMGPSFTTSCSWLYTPDRNCEIESYNRTLNGIMSSPSFEILILCLKCSNYSFVRHIRVRTGQARRAI